MSYFSIKRTLLLFFFFSIGLNGCARRQPTPLDQLSIYRQRNAVKGIESVTANSIPLTQKPTRSFTPFEEIVVSLVFDSLDLLPNDISGKIYDAINNSMEIPDQYDVIDKSVLSSHRKEDIALVAGQFVQLVYGESIGKEGGIPQAILFFNKNRMIYADIAELKSKLSSSENRNLDAYNICLSLLVNSLSTNYGIQQKSREGLYLRDSNNNLYFHKDLKFLLNASHQGIKR